jgi:CBS-domain-containing membrane protein
MMNHPPQSKKQVRDLMSHPVRTLERNDMLSMADTVMRNERIRHLPILDEAGRLVGIVSQRDLFFNALMRALGHGTVPAAKPVIDAPKTIIYRIRLIERTGRFEKR